MPYTILCSSLHKSTAPETIRQKKFQSLEGAPKKVAKRKRLVLDQRGCCTLPPCSQHLYRTVAERALLVYIMTVMLGFHTLLRTRRPAAWYIIPLCLFLVFLGIRVPAVSNKTASPKPSPRAVIETTSESSKFTFAKLVMPMEPCDVVAELPAPLFYALWFLSTVYRLSSTAAPQVSARAPPVRFC